MVSLVSLAALTGPQALKPIIQAHRGIKPADLSKLADLYMHAESDGAINPDGERAAGRISALFDGTHGTPIPQASLVTSDGDGRITAAIITTERAFGSDGSRTAFIAELLTHPDYRRQGLAEGLLTRAIHALHDEGHKTLAVTVNSGNAAAIAFYLSRGFRRLSQNTGND
jgi:ribosomal protein S18 acetylase RimI-like enzyme